MPLETQLQVQAGHLLQHPGGGSACDCSRISGHILVCYPYQYYKSLNCYCSERCAWLFCLASVPVWQTVDAARLWTHHSDIHHCSILDLYMYACRVPDTTPRLYINLEKASGVRLTWMQFWHVRVCCVTHFSYKFVRRCIYMYISIYWV